MPLSRPALTAALLAALCATALLLAPTADARWRAEADRPPPGSGSCRARSTPPSTPTSTRSTASKSPPRPSPSCTAWDERSICYLDVGSWESYRPDAGRFPKAVLGRAYEGYPDERWLDIRRIDLLAPILRDRFDLCRRKGFDAVEPDNIAGYENRTGFPLTAADQLRFNRWVAREVHRRGMAVALKNDPGQVGQLVGRFDFAVVEECFAYDECGMFSPFVAAGKAVFVAEYEEPLDCDLRPGRAPALQRDPQGLRPLRPPLGTLLPLAGATEIGSLEAAVEAQRTDSVAALQQHLRDQRRSDLRGRSRRR